LIVIFFSSCISTSTIVSSITVEKKAIPPDFGQDKSTLICVLWGKKSYDKCMKKHVKNNYKGKYEFVLRRDLVLKKYTDSNNYRYIFDHKLRTGESKSFNYDTNSYSSSTTFSFSFFILDKKEDKTYKSPLRTTRFSNTIEAYMINLEKVRIRNKS